MSDQTHWLWFDFETNGLWLEHEQPPQVLSFGAILLPFGELDSSQALWSGEFDFHLNPGAEAAWPDVVYKMHSVSGLIERCHRSQLKPELIQFEMLSVLWENFIKRGECAMAGSGIAPFDVPLLRMVAPSLYSYLYYTPYDQGLGRRMLHGILDFDIHSSDMPDSSAGHTALADVQAQLRQAQWMRDNIEISWK